MKKKILVISVLVLIAGLLVFFIVRRNTLIEKKLPRTGGVSWSNLTPGISSKDDVLKTLGDPLTERPSGFGTILEFKSQSPARNHEILFEEETSVFYKEIVSIQNKKTTTGLISQYGETQQILYGPDAVNGYYLYVYPEKGLAYLGNQTVKDVLEIWYFPPTLFEEFMSNWATGYSTEFSPGF